MLLLLLGCPAADLGVDLPPEGIGAVSAEDLRRDTELIVKEGAVGWERRMGAMHAVREPGERLCMRQGAGVATVRWAPLNPVDGRVSVGEAVDAAALISLAKAWDTMADKPGAEIYCLGAGEGTRLPAFAPDASAVRTLDFRVLAAQLRKGAL